jgi:hypothetical protein
MNEPIQAKVALPCTVRIPGSHTVPVRGVTRQVTRDEWRVLLAGGPECREFRLDLAVIAAVELPATRGWGQRYLECAAVVRSLERTADGVKALLNVTSIAFTVPQTARAHNSSERGAPRTTKGEDR